MVDCLRNADLLDLSVIFFISDKHTDKGVSQRVFNDTSDRLKLGVLADLGNDLVLGDADDLSVLHLLVTLSLNSTVNNALASLFVGLES